MSRLTVEFPEEINNLLARLAEKEQTSKREVIRRALALYGYLADEGVRAGGDYKLSVTKTKDNQVVKDIVF